MVAEERPLVLPYHNCVELPIRFGDRGQQRGGLGSIHPRQTPRKASIKELRHDHTPTGYHALRDLTLPRPR